MEENLENPRNLYRKDLSPGISLLLSVHGGKNYLLELEFKGEKVSLGWCRHYVGHDPYEVTVEFEKHSQQMAKVLKGFYTHFGLV